MGYFYAISCAFVWASSVVMFKSLGDDLNPIVMNLFKNVLALIFLIPTYYLFEGHLLFDVPYNDHIILLASGLIGIGFADALVLKSITLIGATRFAVVECLYSPLIILISIFVLNESLNLVQSLGIVLVLAAVGVVIFKKVEDKLSPKDFKLGVTLGVLGMLAMAVGIVAAKPAIERTPLIYAVTIRMAAGVFGSVLMLFFVDRKASEFKRLFNNSRWWMLISASMLSAYISMILWVAGFKYVGASIASALNQTSTIFTVLMAWIFLKEKMTVPKLTGVTLAICGVLIITLNR
ncbi:DMT family transporter [Oligoflexaceae bacterium]|nr:DMT family transporter [Oligoflexaceae bacterium]